MSSRRRWESKRADTKKGTTGSTSCMKNTDKKKKEKQKRKILKGKQFLFLFLCFSWFIRSSLVWFAKLMNKHSRYLWHVSASSSSSTFWDWRSFVNGPLVCEDFMLVLLGDFFFRFLLKGKSIRSSSWPFAVVFRSSKWTDTHHPGQPIPFDSLLASFNELFISVSRLSSKFCPAQQPAGAQQLLKDGFSFLFFEIEMKRNGC